MTIHSSGLARQGPYHLLTLLLVGGFVGMILPAVLADNMSANFFAPLSDLNTLPPHRAIGGQNFTRCCLQALSDRTQGNPDITVQSSQSPFNNFTSPTALGDSGQQFPCGATYNSDYPGGAPQVFVSNDWCDSNCAGWQRLVTRNPSQWVQPFVGFILPAAAFCLNVPRRMVVKTPDSLFESNIKNLRRRRRILKARIDHQHRIIDAIHYIAIILLVAVIAISLALRAVIACVLGLLNVILGVAVVFSAATPMILSGVYEALVDYVFLHAIQKDITSEKVIESEKNIKSKPCRENSKPMPDKTASTSASGTEETSTLTEKEKIMQYRIHLLYAILVGNIQFSKPTGPDSYAQSSSHAEAATLPSEPNAWLDVKAVSKQPLGDKPRRRVAAARLKSMLECQNSYGAAIGAPVAFFIGSFLFSILDNQNGLGDNNTAHALAFGEWWTTIPLVAMVSGCLLAGNNPFELECIVSGTGRSVSDIGRSVSGTGGSVSDIEGSVSGTEPSGVPRQRKFEGFWGRLYAPFYNSKYQPVWMWRRGRNKYAWIKAVQEDHQQAAKALAGSLGLLGWTSEVLVAWVLIAAPCVLIAAPCVLAFLTSYYTPTVGMSCRTFTYVLYFSFQLWLAALWFADFSLNPYLHTLDITSNSTSDSAGWPRTLYTWAFYILVAFGFIDALFTTIFGTFLQLLGVYRNCKCDIPIRDWRQGGFMFTISTNSAAMIYYARVYWLGTGVACIVMLGVVCYLGWWYQRHSRAYFKKVIIDVLDLGDSSQVQRDQ